MNSVSERKPNYPWRLDTNERYREVVRSIMGLATASLLLPVFFARDFLGIDPRTPLIRVFTSSLYWAWALLGLPVFSGVVFHYLSTKWIRLAWGQEEKVFWRKVTDQFIDRALDISFWVTVFAFIAGLILILVFFSTVASILPR